MGLGAMILLALDPVHLGPMTLVQLVSYVLVDDSGVISMLINLVFIWLIVSPFEQTFGQRHTLELVAAGVIGGSLATVLVAQVAPLAFRLTGSSTITYAGLAALTQVMRGRSMMFFGVIPMTSRQLLLVMLVLAALLSLEAHNHLLFAAWLGSMLAGGGYVRYMSRRPRRSPPKRPGSSRFRVLRGGGGGGGRGNGDSDRPKWLN
jgi:membrane associated rhomboid family serine protease